MGGSGPDRESAAQSGAIIIDHSEQLAEIEFGIFVHSAEDQVTMHVGRQAPQMAGRLDSQSNQPGRLGDTGQRTVQQTAPI